MNGNLAFLDSGDVNITYHAYIQYQYYQREKYWNARIVTVKKPGDVNITYHPYIKYKYCKYYILSLHEIQIL